jgi:hypothetical protein
VHTGQTLGPGVGGQRKVDECERDSVAERLSLLGGADAHRDHRLQRRGLLAALERQRPQPAGDDRQCRIVDGRPVRAGRALQVRQRRRVTYERPPRTDARVERRRRSRPQEVRAHDERRPPQGAGDAHGRGARLPRQPRRAACRSEQLLAAGRESSRRQPSRPRRRRRLPRYGELGNGIPFEVEQEQRHFQRGLPVHQRVVDFRHEAAASAREPRRKMDLPQRARALKRHRQHPIAEEAEAVIVELLAAHSELQHVLGDVEVRVVDPERLAQARQRVGKATAEARRVVEARGDAAPQAAQRGRRRVGPHAEGCAPGDVHVRVGRLDAEEGPIDRGEASAIDGQHCAGRPPRSSDACRKFGPEGSTGGRMST